MPTYVALLRGVNVGKAKRVPMGRLQALLLSLGYRSVSTLLNSGNVVFSAPRSTSAKHAEAIAQALEAEFNFEVPVVVKSAVELTRIIKENTLVSAALDHSRLLVVFAQASSTLSGLAGLADLVVPPEQLLIGKHATFLHCASGILQSAAGGALIGKVGKAVTTRNWATVLKLQALAAKCAA
jgi:uncharacterized protein (DUF1697 family)